MADPASTARRQQSAQQGLIASAITLPFRLLGVLFGSLFLSIIIEWVGMHLFWPDESWHHAESMLNHELDQLSDHFKQSLLLREPSHTAHQVVTQTYDALLVETGLIEWARDASEHAQSESRSRNGFTRLLGLAYVQAEAYILAAIYTFLTFLVRLVVLILSLPLFVLTAFVALIDGLVRRDLRKFGAGRESGFLYHRARATLMPVAVLPWMLYLSLPISVHPLLILLPSAALLGLAVNITAGSFKKYL